MSLRRYAGINNIFAVIIIKLRYAAWLTNLRDREEGKKLCLMKNPRLWLNSPCVIAFWIIARA